MDNNRRSKKVSITEEDVCTLLQRYSAATVLAILKELDQCVDVKLDWQELVNKTDSGIKTAREYQMLWRHLAYRHPLVENLSADDQPLDDDSDLEYELEAYPPASTVDALEASNCVKVLTSGSTNKSRGPNSSNLEVPRVTFSHVQKQSQAVGTSGEKLEANGPTSNNQKKRKLCSDEEELERVAPVKKGEIKGEKNSSQRTQRKKQGSGASAPLSAAQLATRYALDMALKDGPTTGATVENRNTGSHNAAKASAPKRNVQVVKITAPSSQPHPSSVTGAVSSGKAAPIASSSKLCPQKKAPPQSSVSQESIQAAAVAAGARIASPSDAATLLKAVQSKNAVHIRGGGPVVKTTAAANSSPLPPNVHLICTGKTTPPTSVAAGTASLSVGGQQTKGSAVGSAVPSTVPPATTKVSALGSAVPPAITKGSTVGSAVPPATTKASTVGSVVPPATAKGSAVGSAVPPASTKASTVGSVVPPATAKGSAVGSAVPPATTKVSAVGSVVPPATTKGSATGSVVPPATTKGSVVGSTVPPATTKGSAVGSAVPTATTKGSAVGSTVPTATTKGIAVGSTVPTATTKGIAVGSAVPPAIQLPKVRPTSSVAMERTSVAQQAENRTSSSINIQGSDATPMTKVQEDGASVPQSLPKPALGKTQALSLGTNIGHSKQTGVVNSQSALNKDVAEIKSKNDTSKQILEIPLPKNDDKQPHAVQRSNPCENGTQGVSSSTIVDRGTEKVEVSK